MKKFNKQSLNLQLTIAFGVVLFVPLIIAAVFSIVYFTRKVEQEAVKKTESVLRAAEIILQDSVYEMEKTATIFASKEEFVALADSDMSKISWSYPGEKFFEDKPDMITVVDKSYTVVGRIHNPEHSGDKIVPISHADKAFLGIPSCGIEVMTQEMLESEGTGDKFSEKTLFMTGVAPVYDHPDENIVSIVIARRALDYRVIEKIGRTLSLDADLFDDSVRHTSMLADDPLLLPSDASETQKSVVFADISTNGSIMGYLPISSFSDVYVGTLVIRIGPAPHIRMRNKAVLTLSGIFVIGFVLTSAVKALMYRKLDKSYTALEKTAEEIRSLHRELIRAQENERQRIALDIHDGVAQELAEVLHRYEAVSLTRESVRECNKRLEKSIDDLRKLVYGLFPSDLRQFGLTEALGGLCISFEKKTGISTEFFTAGKPDYDYESGISLFRLVQESLNNVKKHSEADHVSVRIVRSHNNETIIRVADNGKGFDADQSVSGSHVGIRGMRERVRHLGGEIEIDSQPDKGTSISVRIGK